MQSFSYRAQAVQQNIQTYCTCLLQVYIEPSLLYSARKGIRDGRKPQQRSLIPFALEANAPRANSPLEFHTTRGCRLYFMGGERRFGAHMAQFQSAAAAANDLFCQRATEAA